MKLGNKPQQYKLKIIKNQINQGVIRFKINNDIKDLIYINNNYGRQISYHINQDFDIVEFDSNNPITLFAKFEYKIQGKNIEEISYGATPKYISKYNEFPLVFYIKYINDKRIDFNIVLEGKIGNLDITGYFVDFQKFTKIDNDKNSIFENLPEDFYQGIYDNGTQNGIIGFNKYNGNNEINSDIYYIVMISLSNDNSILNNANLSSRIVINAYPRESKDNVIPSGKYIRGMLNLGEYDEGKIYYIKETNYCRIFFSSNYKNLQIVIDNNDNNTKIENKSLGYARLYTIKGHIDKFNIKLINNSNISKSSSDININYIFKYETENKTKYWENKTKHRKNNTKHFENKTKYFEIKKEESENDNLDNQEIRNFSKKTNITHQINSITDKGNKR